MPIALQTNLVALWTSTCRGSLVSLTLPWPPRIFIPLPTFFLSFYSSPAANNYHARQDQKTDMHAGIDFTQYYLHKVSWSRPRLHQKVRHRRLPTLKAAALGGFFLKTPRRTLTRFQQITVLPLSSVPSPTTPSRFDRCNQIILSIISRRHQPSRPTPIKPCAGLARHRTPRIAPIRKKGLERPLEHGTQGSAPNLISENLDCLAHD